MTAWLLLQAYHCSVRSVFALARPDTERGGLYFGKKAVQ